MERRGEERDEKGSESIFLYLESLFKQEEVSGSYFVELLSQKGKASQGKWNLKE